ncbi:MAG: gas vesicle protein GvpC [Scytolyngbya sp. HA4215-MV1]|jgi:gas vesicle GvpC-like protein|nr:gas vesicle protein GvpC [Scytolyngbya sp. HA4215-MV1]
MALRHEWQAQRQHRQQEFAQRQQQVQESLASARQERQHTAAQLRDDLSLFRESLMQNEKVRSLQCQKFQSELQQFCQTLQQETQAFLSSANDRRQAQAQALAQQLDAFVQALQHQTVEFLALTRAERSTMAQQLSQDLQAFHTRLATTVVALRQEIQLLHQQIQSEVEALRIDTQQSLAINQQQRLQVKMQLTQDLAAFTDNLRQEVELYLLEVATQRQQRAEQLSQTLSQSRDDRFAEVQSLFTRLGEFRTELKAFQANLHQTVWGTHSSSSSVQVTQPTAKEPAVKSTPRSLTVVPSAPPSPPVASAPVVSTPVAENKPTNPVVNNVEVSVATMPSVETVPPTQGTKAILEDAIVYEKDVYNYIHEIQGARLTQIESALGISRFQAVDALRSLIKKGLVTQRDRVYLAQETFV